MLGKNTSYQFQAKGNTFNQAGIRTSDFTSMPRNIIACHLVEMLFVMLRNTNQLTIPPSLHFPIAFHKVSSFRKGKILMKHMIDRSSRIWLVLLIICASRTLVQCFFLLFAGVWSPEAEDGVDGYAYSSLFACCYLIELT